MTDTPIYTRAAVDHLEASLDREPVVYEPPPRPQWEDAEVMVAGIEGKAIVRSGRFPAWVRR